MGWWSLPSEILMGRVLSSVLFGKLSMTPRRGLMNSSKLISSPCARWSRRLANLTAHATCCKYGVPSWHRRTRLCTLLHQESCPRGCIRTQPIWSSLKWFRTIFGLASLDLLLEISVPGSLGPLVKKVVGRFRFWRRGIVSGCVVIEYCVS